VSYCYNDTSNDDTDVTTTQGMSQIWQHCTLFRLTGSAVQWVAVWWFKDRKIHIANWTEFTLSWAILTHYYGTILFAVLHFTQLREYSSAVKRVSISIPTGVSCKEEWQSKIRGSVNLPMFIDQDQVDLFFMAYLLPPSNPGRYTNVHFSNVQSTKL
jgi:hypothetical protein